MRAAINGGETSHNRISINLQILKALCQADKVAQVGRGLVPSYTTGLGDGWELTGPCHKQRLVSTPLSLPESGADLDEGDEQLTERGKAHGQAGTLGTVPTLVLHWTCSSSSCCEQLQAFVTTTLLWH
jgi:hypothetical protein